MRVTLYPFFSQQDKAQRKFRLSSDSGVKLYCYIAKRMVGVGWEPTLVLPHPSQCVDYVEAPCRTRVVPYNVAVDNLDRRLQWEPSFLRQLAEDSDLLLTQHEFLPIPLRALAPELPVVMECGIRPDTAWPETAALFPLAWGSASLVHCNSQPLAETVDAPRVRVWQFAYDADVFEPAPGPKTVDVVFPARASATGYSGHRAFVDAMRSSPLVVRMTDPTGYLGVTGECPCEWLAGNPLDSATYLRLLRSSRVVVSLTTNGYGGYAFREAIACGCVPVALRRPEYVELLGKSWPYYTDGSDVRAVSTAAAYYGWHSELRAGVLERLVESSYQRAWEKAYVDLQEVLRDRRPRGS